MAAELLTPDEHRAIERAGELWNLLCRIVGDGPSRAGDLDELRHLIHGIQRAVMKQAAARAYPDRYRLLGGDAPAAGGSPPERCVPPAQSAQDAPARAGRYLPDGQPGHGDLGAQDRRSADATWIMMQRGAVRIVEQLRLTHFQDGRRCRSCQVAWPCPTMTIVANTEPWASLPSGVGLSRLESGGQATYAREER